MEQTEVKALLESRGMVYKGDFIEALSEAAFNKGMIKFNIPNSEKIHSLNGEGVWGWVTEENKKLYDTTYTGTMSVILCNSPLNYMGILFWGTEVEVQCSGNNRPILLPQWVKDKILSAEWYNAK